MCFVFYHCFDVCFVVFQDYDEVGPRDECRASPLRAAGTPVTSKRRAGLPDYHSTKRAAQGEGERPLGLNDSDDNNDNNINNNNNNNNNEFYTDRPSRSVFAARRPFHAQLSEMPQHDGRFSLEQVRRMVDTAVKDRERQLREEYDAILLDKLDEQWKMFASYSEHQLHNKMEESRHDYYC